VEGGTVDHGPKTITKELRMERESDVMTDDSRLLKTQYKCRILNLSVKL